MLGIVLSVIVIEDYLMLGIVFSETLIWGKFMLGIVFSDIRQAKLDVGFCVF